MLTLTDNSGIGGGANDKRAYPAWTIDVSTPSSNHLRQKAAGAGSFGDFWGWEERSAPVRSRRAMLRRPGARRPRQSRSPVQVIRFHADRVAVVRQAVTNAVPIAVRLALPNAAITPVVTVPAMAKSSVALRDRSYATGNASHLVFVARIGIAQPDLPVSITSASPPVSRTSAARASKIPIAAAAFAETEGFAGHSPRHVPPARISVRSRIQSSTVEIRAAARFWRAARVSASNSTREPAEKVVTNAPPAPFAVGPARVASAPWPASYRAEIRTRVSLLTPASLWRMAPPGRSGRSPSAIWSSELVVLSIVWSRSRLRNWEAGFSTP